MGWKNAFEYVRGAAVKHGVGGVATQDQGLPLGARIGSLVGLQQAPLIRAQAAGALAAMPRDGDDRIVAVSQLKLGLAGSLYRYYLATGDADARERFLQVYSDGQGKPAEILYCSQLARVIPETAEEQDAYTGVSGCGLGEPGYTLWREQLGDAGLDEDQLEQAFGAAGRLDYVRDAGDPAAAFVAPYRGDETRIDDADGMCGLRQEMHFMPYVRALADGGREYLLISTEIVASVNGDTSQRGIHVDFVIGIPLEQERVAIQ